jgi:hypothetical protein
MIARFAESYRRWPAAQRWFVAIGAAFVASAACFGFLSWLMADVFTSLVLKVGLHGHGQAGSIVASCISMAVSISILFSASRRGKARPAQPRVDPAMKLNL